jgi:hypothetical protein
MTDGPDGFGRERISTDASQLCRGRAGEIRGARRPASGFWENPVILDFDASVLPLDADEIRIPLSGWQESIRFGCTRRRYAALEAHLEKALPPAYGCVFTGSGDYHHLSLSLLRILARRRNFAPASLDLAVCDNHPDNMRYPFGLHCGSWVRHAAELDCVRHIHVIGITSADIGLARAWENYLTPFIRRKLFYWSVGPRAAWLALLGRGGHGRSFASADALLKSVAPVLRNSAAVYLSMDKDALAPGVARTNWDQGVLEAAHLEKLIRACSGRLAGCDVTGDVSSYAYAGIFKRVLSRLDGRTALDAETVASWRSAQQKINIRLMECLRIAAHAEPRPVGKNGRHRPYPKH